MIGPAELDITIYAGADFSLPLELFDSSNVPVALNGAAVNAKVRNNVADVAALLTFTGLVTGANTCTISATGAQTGAVVLPAAKNKRRPLTRYLWDCEITFADGSIQRILEGVCLFSPEAGK